eukprot:6197833-Pleurochrysis_carterae.AAC.8
MAVAAHKNAKLGNWGAADGLRRVTGNTVRVILVVPETQQSANMSNISKTHQGSEQSCRGEGA